MEVLCVDVHIEGGSVLAYFNRASLHTLYIDDIVQHLLIKVGIHASMTE